MPQFDIHRNPGASRDSIPYVVVVQTSILDGYRRRVVVPLVRASSLGKIDNPTFNPTFVVENVAVVLHPLEIVSVSDDRLGPSIGTLARDGDRILGALDKLLSRA